MSFHGQEGLTHNLEFGAMEATLEETAFSGLRVIGDRRRDQRRQMDRNPPSEENNRLGQRDRRQTAPLFSMGDLVIYEPQPPGMPPMVR